MKISFLIVFLLLFCSNEAGAFTISGAIGDYPIEMEIETVDREAATLSGKYKYTSKSSYLDLEGEISHDILYIEESYKGEVTGSFYLQFVGDELKGKWISGKKWYPVNLNISNEIQGKFNTKSLSDYAKDVSTDISGGYANESYFLNDMWFREDDPQMEIGFNGGALILEKYGEDSLKFTVNTICGPTYHIAYASAIAYRSTEDTYDCLLEVYDGDTCFINIELSAKSAHISAKGNFVCGFGARAYLDHSFIKITDRYKFEEEEVSIGEMKRSQ